MAHLNDYNSYSNAHRTSCSAGSRHFYIGSRGDVSRCAGYWYGLKDVMGNIKDPEFRSSIFQNQDNWQPCRTPKCTMECDGYLVQQTLATKEPLHHTGSKLIDYDLFKKNYCSLMIHLTANCNMSCSYCCAQGWMKKHQGEDMTSDEWMEAIALFTEHFEAGFVQIMGGEPTIKRGWQQIAHHFIAAGWQIEILTNFAKDREIVDFVNSIPEHQRHQCMIYISLHPTQKAFDDARLMTGLYQLYELRAHFACSLVITEENQRIAQELNLEKRVRNMGVKWFGTVTDFGFTEF